DGGAQAVFTSSGSGEWIKRAEASNGVSITSLVPAPSNAAIIYASAWVGTSPRGAVYVSRDGGTTWSFLHLFENSSILAMAVDPSEPSIVYAGGFTQEGASLFRSLDGGYSWYPLSIPSAALSVAALAIDPQKPSRLYAGTNCVLYASGDLGKDWTALYGSTDCFPVAAVAVSPADSDTVYI